MRLYLIVYVGSYTINCILYGIDFTGGGISGGIHINIISAEQCGKFLISNL